MTELCKLLNINQSTSTTYHHQALGMVERSHRTFNEYIRSYLSPEKSDWDEWLKCFTYCYNTTPSTVHEYTPFELVYGKTPQPFTFVTGTTDPVYNFDDYVKELKFRLQEEHKPALRFTEQKKLESKTIYDIAIAQNTQIYDKVYLRDETRHMK